MAKGLVLISAIILYSLAYYANDITDDDNYASALISQIHQCSIDKDSENYQ